MIWGAVWHDGKSDLTLMENLLNGEKYNSMFEQALLALFDEKVDENVMLSEEMVLLAVSAGFLSGGKAIMV